MNHFKYPQAKILSGQSLSAAIDLEMLNAPVAIVMPAAWDAASLTFQGADAEGGTYNNVYDSSGAELTVTAAAARRIMLVPSLFAGLRWVKVRSGTSGVPVNQTADRVVQLVAREV